jgi:hypothetical protein
LRAAWRRTPAARQARGHEYPSRSRYSGVASALKTSPPASIAIPKATSARLASPEARFSSTSTPEGWSTRNRNVKVAKASGITQPRT